MFCKLGKFKKTSTFPFLLTYFLILESSSIRDIQEVQIISQIFIISIFLSLSSLFCVIFEIILYCRFENKARYWERDNEIGSIYQGLKLMNKEKSNKHSLVKTILLFLLIIILDSVTNFGFVYREYLLKNQSNPLFIQNGMKGILILSSTLFCFLILKYRIERYKVIGLLIILFSFVFNGILSIFEKNIEYSITLIIEFFINFLTGIQEVIEKYLMHYKFQSPYKILFLEGLLGVILLLCGIGISLINIGFNPIILSNWFIDNLKPLLLFTLFCMGYNCFRILINRDFSPTHRVISDSFYSFVLHTFQMLSIKFTFLHIGYFFGYLFVVIGSLIYNEIIILTCCGIDKDTRKKISMRGINEVKSVINDLGIIRLEEDNDFIPDTINKEIAE